jgi:transcriptional regulator of arginine metabolism
MKFYSSHLITMHTDRTADSSRARRLTLVAQLLSGKRFSSQEELAKALARTGVSVTQATLSRDLRSLGVLKRPDPSGKTVYELPAPATETFDRERQLLDLKAFVNQVRLAQNLVVVRTPPGHANGVARAIDLANFEDNLGSVAGDDTVLVVMEDVAAARRLKRHLDSIATNGAGK